jgi:hypothetical protein
VKLSGICIKWLKRSVSFHFSLINSFLDEKVNRNTNSIEDVKKLLLNTVEKFDLSAFEKSIRKLEDAMEIFEEDFDGFKKNVAVQRDKDFMHIRSCQKE